VEFIVYAALNYTKKERQTYNISTRAS